jgi:hypothetical protein
MRDTGVVEGAVETAVCGHGSLDQCFDLRFNGHIGFDEEPFAAYFAHKADGLFPLGLPPACDYHFCPLARKGDRRGSANA